MAGDSRRNLRSTLPHQFTTFVGRKPEIAALKRLLGTHRLVTITGPGGVGKTRLTLEVAEAARAAFRDGVFFVDLARVQDPSSVNLAIAAALDRRGHPGKRSDEELYDYLTDKHLLLILDNCEHLLSQVAAAASRTLASAGDVRIVATSREPLNIAGESVWPLLPLTTPSVEDRDTRAAQSAIEQYESVALFVDRARAVIRDFTLTPENAPVVARLCARLDGLPLAIELATVRLRTLSPEQILDRLARRFELLTAGNRAAPPRQQTLRAAMEWSFDLCPEPERILWARCSVFAADFEVEAAEYVCADQRLPSDEILNGVAGLVDKSILVPIVTGNPVRYRMLETVRQFGIERLDSADGEARFRRMHRDYYLALAERCDADSSSDRQVEWSRRLRQERPNLLAALEYCIRTEDEARTGLRMASALWFYWIACGLLRDAEHWIDRLLAVGTESTVERARALWVVGWARLLAGHNDSGVTALEESRVIATELGDDTAATYAVQLLGLAKILRNDVAGAAPLLDRAILTHRRRAEWSATALMALTQRAYIAATIGDTTCAVPLAEECQRIAEKADERWASAWVAFVLSLAAWAAGDAVTAARHAREGYRRHYEIGDQLAIPSCMETLAWSRVAQGCHDEAAVLFGAADTVWKRIGEPLFGDRALLSWSRANRELAEAELGSARFRKLRDRGSRMRDDEINEFISGDPGTPAGHRGPQPDTPTSAPRLTRREAEVADLVSKGMSNRGIAAALVISQRTAEAHVENILAKMGFSSRTQIAAWVHGSVVSADT